LSYAPTIDFAPAITAPASAEDSDLLLAFGDGARGSDGGLQLVCHFFSTMSAPRTRDRSVVFPLAWY
jgi:hypothetical protein